VNPVELVSTDPRLVLAVFSIADWPAAAAAGAADVLGELAVPDVELLPQAASRAASRTPKTANTGGIHFL
jgi:hypothetical protein